MLKKGTRVGNFIGVILLVPLLVIMLIMFLSSGSRNVVKVDVQNVPAVPPTPEQLAEQEKSRQEALLSQQAADKKAQEEKSIAAAKLAKQFKIDRKTTMKLMRDAMKSGYPIAAAIGASYASVDDKEFQKLYSEAKLYDAQIQAKANARIAERSQRMNQFQAVDPNSEILYAQGYCRDKVRQSLSSPSTADFKMLDDVLVSNTHEFYTVISHVDAQNSFGAIVRLNYSCRLKYNGGGQAGWSVEEFRVDGQ